MQLRSPLAAIQQFHQELVAVRRDLHAHPEIGFEEIRTSGIVAGALTALGVEVHRGIGKTGVVGVIRGQRTDSGKMIGLRADMDALPMSEEGSAEYCSTVPGMMHACGHDGHTTILLGTAKYLMQNRNFNGTAVLIFQPAKRVWAVQKPWWMMACLSVSLATLYTPCTIGQVYLPARSALILGQ